MIPNWYWKYFNGRKILFIILNEKRVFCDDFNEDLDDSKITILSNSLKTPEFSSFDSFLNCNRLYFYDYIQNDIYDYYFEN